MSFKVSPFQNELLCRSICKCKWLKCCFTVNTIRSSMSPSSEPTSVCDSSINLWHCCVAAIPSTLQYTGLNLPRQHIENTYNCARHHILQFFQLESPLTRASQNFSIGLCVVSPSEAANNVSYTGWLVAHATATTYGVSSAAAQSNPIN